MVRLHTWSAAISFASGACAMLHAPARVARSSRSTGAVWAMMVLVVGCCWMGMRDMKMSKKERETGVGTSWVAGLFVVVSESSSVY